MTKVLHTYSGLPRSIYMLSVARFINSMGEFIPPMLTLYLTQRLLFHEDKAGFILMIAILLCAPGVLLGGSLADKWSKKRIVIVAQLLVGLLIMSCGLFIHSTIIVVYLLAGAYFFYSIAKPAYNALYIDLTEDDQRKSAFSLMYLSINAGLAVGPLLAGIFFPHHLQMVFYVIGIVTILSLLFIVLYVPQTPASVVRKKEGKEQDKKSMLRALIGRPILLMFLLVSLLNYFVFTQFTFSLPLQMNGLFGSSAGVVFYSTLVTINAICVIVLTPLMTALTKKWTSIVSNIVGALLYAAGFGMLYYAHSAVPIIISTILWTIGEILIQTNVYVYIAEKSPMEYRARFNSLLLLIGVGGFALGPSMTGLFIRSYGINLVWPMIFIISMFYAGLLYVLYGMEKRKQARVHLSDVSG